MRLPLLPESQVGLDVRRVESCSTASHDLQSDQFDVQQGGLADEQGKGRSGRNMDEEDGYQFDEPFEVSLATFAHQVGGHSALFLMDSATVCKVLIPRELRFYQHAPDELRPFLAEYKGILFHSVVNTV